MSEHVNAPRVRTRFPPSPTGALHLGGARTALFNWLFARHHGGQFVFRLEDTDRERSKAEHVDSIMGAMTWLGLDWDEGPYYQSQRFDRYREAIAAMVAKGRAYWCHCPPERLEKVRAQALASGGKPMYDGCCRELGLGPAPGAVVRFKGPRGGVTAWNDLIKGPISFDNSELDDLVILRSDGSPTYHLAVVVDDVDMNISHVIRGDDHVSNTPRQILLYQALDSPAPQFGHVPMILGADKTKLSKRHGATAVVEYQKLGYLPEAMLNALARLGWSHGDQEIFSREELVAAFNLEAVGRGAAVFDPDKLLHLNAHWMQRAEARRLAELLPPFLAERGVATHDQATLIKAIPHLTARAKTLVELADWAEPYLLAEPVMDPKAAAKFLTAASRPVLTRVADLVRELGVDNPAGMEEAFRRLAEDLGLKLGGVAQPVRVALVGRTASPGIFEVMAILGRERTLARLERALALAAG
ncbi:MAG: glutamate--tRNA ligase [Thermodesulfobacteriota bacterium]